MPPGPQTSVQRRPSHPTMPGTAMPTMPGAQTMPTMPGTAMPGASTMSGMPGMPSRPTMHGEPGRQPPPRGYAPPQGGGQSMPMPPGGSRPLPSRVRPTGAPDAVTGPPPPTLGGRPTGRMPLSRGHPPSSMLHSRPLQEANVPSQRHPDQPISPPSGLRSRPTLSGPGMCLVLFAKMRIFVWGFANFSWYKISKTLYLKSFDWGIAKSLQFGYWLQRHVILMRKKC
jgi:hypothetical protein